MWKITSPQPNQLLMQSYRVFILNRLFLEYKLRKWYEPQLLMSSC
jgi:hypothetical protein